MKKSKKIRDDIQRISLDSFEYFKANETTFVCDCPASKSMVKKQKCWADFQKLNQIKK